MGLFDSRYYSLNKRFMSFFGMWPLQTSIKSRLMFYLTLFFIFFTMFIPELIKIGELAPVDIDAMIECIPPVLILTVSLVKSFTVCFRINNFKVLLKHIENDWESLTNDDEVAILRKFAENGRKCTIWYTAFLAFTTIVYVSLPVSPVVLNYFSPLNESREMELLFCTEYFVDEKEYFKIILSYDYFIAVYTVSILAATDTMYMTYCEHACGIFAIVSYRLQSIQLDVDYDPKFRNDIPDEKDDSYETLDRKYYKILLSSAAKHRTAIEYVELFQKCYTESLMGQLSLNVVCMTFTGVQTIINLHNYSELFRFGLLTIAEAFHLFLLTLPGQRIKDYSAKIFGDGYHTHWYVLSPKCRKILGVILLRSITPCQISAGGLYAMTYENYVALMQTTMSYFTVLSSVR